MAPSDATPNGTAQMIIVMRRTARPARKMGSIVLMENALSAPGNVTDIRSAQMGAMRWSALHAWKMGSIVPMENALTALCDAIVKMTAQMGATRTRWGALTALSADHLRR